MSLRKYINFTLNSNNFSTIFKKKRNTCFVFRSICTNFATQKQSIAELAQLVEQLIRPKDEQGVGLGVNENILENILPN